MYFQFSKFPGKKNTLFVILEVMVLAVSITVLGRPATSANRRP